MGDQLAHHRRPAAGRVHRDHDGHLLGDRSRPGYRLLRRSMVTAVDTDAGIPRPLLDLFGGNAWHDAHLAAVKRAVEPR
ncbi:hypothetical protein ACW9HQ_51850 [Nocardia gipuzkoensis]